MAAENNVFLNNSRTNKQIFKIPTAYVHENRVLFRWLESVWIDFRISKGIFSLNTAGEYVPFKIERGMLRSKPKNDWLLLSFKFIQGVIFKWFWHEGENFSSSFV